MIPAAPPIAGAEHLHSGKVRDIYRLTAGEFAGNLLLVASDRISAFDHVLSSTIPDKGAILTQLSLWWFDQLAEVVPNHVVSTKVPAEVAGRALICTDLQMYPVECVARGYLTGSGLLDYQQSGEVCGVPLPESLLDGSQLPNPIYTPATKAAVGDHDENIGFAETEQLVGAEKAAELRDLTLKIYQHASGLAQARGIIVADTKFEFGETNGRTILADEVLTPDSSRFWPADAWKPGQTQPSFDKQIVRNWLLHESGWDKNSTAAPPELPNEIIERTRERYLSVFQLLTGNKF